MHWRVCDLADRLAGERRTGLVFVDDYGHRRDYAFAEIAEFSARYAAVLRAFGVQEGEHVHVRLSTTGKCIFTLLALERLGAHAVFDYHDVARASTIISNRKYRRAIDAARDRFHADARYVIIGEECEGWARLDTLAQVASAVDVAQPEIDEAQLEDARAQASAYLAAVPTDIIWCALQIDDVDWLQHAVAQPWLCGSAVIAHSGEFDPRERLDLVRELDVTILLQRAEDYHAELALPDSTRFKMPRLRRCMLLAEAHDEPLQTQWAERFSVPLVRPYAAASPHP